MWDCLKCLTRAIAAGLLHCPHCGQPKDGPVAEPEAVPVPVLPASAQPEAKM